MQHFYWFYFWVCQQFNTFSILNHPAQHIGLFLGFLAVCLAESMFMRTTLGEDRRATYFLPEVYPEECNTNIMAPDPPSKVNK